MLIQDHDRAGGYWGAVYAFTGSRELTDDIVADAKSGEGWFRYSVNWTKAPDKRWLVRLGQNPDAAVKLAYCHSYQFVRVRVEHPPGNRSPPRAPVPRLLSRSTSSP